MCSSDLTIGLRDGRAVRAVHRDDADFHPIAVVDGIFGNQALQHCYSLFLFARWRLALGILLRYLKKIYIGGPACAFFRNR